MAEINLPSFDALDPLTPCIVMEFEVSRALVSAQQLLLQQQLRLEIDQLLRGILRDFPKSGVVIPENLYLVEVTVEEGSIKAIVRFTRATAMALLLAIGGCAYENPPSYVTIVNNTLTNVQDKVQDDVKEIARDSYVATKQTQVQIGAIGEIDQTLASIQSRRISADEGVLQLVRIFDEINKSPDRSALVKALTVYIDARYGPDFFPDLRKMLGVSATQRVATGTQIRQATHGLQITIVVEIPSSTPPPQVTPEVIRQIVREEIKRAADLAGDDWIPVVGAVREGRPGKAIWELMMVIATLEGVMQAAERLIRYRKAIANNAAPRIQSELAKLGVNASAQVKPSEQTIATIVAVAKSVKQTGPAAIAELSDKVEQAASTEKNHDVKAELKAQSEELKNAA